MGVSLVDGAQLKSSTTDSVPGPVQTRADFTFFLLDVAAATETLQRHIERRMRQLVGLCRQKTGQQRHTHRTGVYGHVCQNLAASVREPPVTCQRLISAKNHWLHTNTLYQRKTTSYLPTSHISEKPPVTYQHLISAKNHRLPANML